MANVEYRNIAKSYGMVQVLKQVDLDIADQEFAVLLGASGCGKTTLLRMTAGLETISSGDLVIDGVRMNDVHPRARNTAMVFQNYALYPTMNVFDNIAFSLQIKKLPPAEIRERVERIANILNLSPFLKRFPRELSGGQRQRVAMGRAMVRDAEVFLFDEPLSNLDAKLRAQMRVEIRQLHEDLNTTTIYVTHDQIEAMTMADKIVLMKDGLIEQVGTPEDLYDRPATLFVADFIGSPPMNFVQGVIHHEPGQSFVEHETLRLPLGRTIEAPAGTAVTCGLRPQELALVDEGDFRGKVKLVEKTGADQNIHLESSGVEIIVTVPRAQAVTIGSHVGLQPDHDKLHLFDADGRRMAAEGRAIT
ncbi:MAG: sn-glycerol-3-phosphate ABC transporter ATP-binding protein UgpC [Thiothrix sp.]|nr:sn-glycerol-3-phosphate ABC transporter ATP-binding protein UgpC [Thiothrix sp.]HPE60355.1 sn-glycerol-3-phosphate ABC transporter ATP-binding protein UgpC [Thiolinea sp.]